MGSCCSPAVYRTPTNHKVVGLKSAWSWASLLSFFLIACHVCPRMGPSWRYCPIGKMANYLYSLGQTKHTVQKILCNTLVLVICSASSCTSICWLLKLHFFNDGPIPRLHKILKFANTHLQDFCTRQCCMIW